METIKNFNLNEYNFILSKSLEIIFGIIFLFIGLWVIKKFIKALDRLMTKRNIDPSLIPFLK